MLEPAARTAPSPLAAGTPPPWQALPADVADRVIRPVFEEIAESVVRELDARQPDTLVHAQLVRNLRLGLEAALEQFAELIQGRRVTPDTAPFEILGRKHARAGFALDDLLAFYRLGGLVSWRCFSRVQQQGELDAATLALLGEALFAYMHELSAAATTGYTTANSDAASLAQARVHGLVRRLVLGDRPEDLDHHAAQVGWPLPDEVALLTSQVPQGRLPQARWPDDVLIAPVEEVLCVVVPHTPGGDRTEELASCATPAATVVLGPVVPVARAADSYQRAREVLDLVELGAVARSALVIATDHTVTAVVHREVELLRDLAQRHLTPLMALPEHRRAPLLDTLAAWVAQPGHPTRIAARLCVHVQTVRYRLRQLRQLLGPVVDDPDRRLELDLALRAVGLDSESSTSPPRDGERSAGVER